MHKILMAVRLAITRTAVRQHLSALERDGLIQRGMTRPTGRRPEQLYSITPLGKELFPKQYQLLADLLISEVATMIGHETLVKLMRGLGTRMATGMATQVLTEDEIIGHMNRAGYEAEIIFRDSGNTEIVAHNCVFHYWPRCILRCVRSTWL